MILHCRWIIRAPQISQVNPSSFAGIFGLADAAKGFASLFFDSMDNAA
jgi:hypothetical protein